jgi:hypothetical protein
MQVHGSAAAAAAASAGLRSVSSGPRGLKSVTTTAVNRATKRATLRGPTRGLVEEGTDERSKDMRIPKIIHQVFISDGGWKHLEELAMQPKAHYRRAWWRSCQVRFQGQVARACHRHQRSHPTSTLVSSGLIATGPSQRCCYTEQGAPLLRRTVANNLCACWWLDLEGRHSSACIVSLPATHCALRLRSACGGKSPGVCSGGPRQRPQMTSLRAPSVPSSERRSDAVPPHCICEQVTGKPGGYLCWVHTRGRQAWGACWVHGQSRGQHGAARGPPSRGVVGARVYQRAS